ncbi:MAG: spore germination protein, partial [Clostridia bacterium]|nr:spore germination protein [Clostridia bacterium]
MKLLSGKIEQDIKTLDKALRVSDNFDIHVKEAVIAGRKAKLYFVNSFTKDEVLEMLLVRLSVLKKREINSCVNAKNFSEKYVSYGECSQEKDVDMICLSVLSGTTAMIIDDFKEAIIIDCRSYPSKSIEEPDSDRVLRGSHDGFCETLTVNAALIRRRFRDTDLIIKNMKAGKKSKTDLFVCYLEDKVDKKSLQVLLKKIEAIDVNTLSMSQQSLAECLLPKQWYNPFPKIRYTERPDTVTATVSEGNIVVMIDNSP